MGGHEAKRPGANGIEEEHRHPNRRRPSRCIVRYVLVDTGVFSLDLIF